MKKELETDVGDLEMALEHANARAMETQGSIKKYAQQIRDVQANLEDKSVQKSNAQEALVAAERRANVAKNALEEARSLLEQSDRNRRAAEQVSLESHSNMDNTIILPGTLQHQRGTGRGGQRQPEPDRQQEEAGG